MYHAHTPARSLSTTSDPLRQYPEIPELLWWYKCARKYPYPSDLIACLIAETRSEEYRHYPCPVDSTHWHVGRGQNNAEKKYLVQRAKRAYRKAVRDEIWREHVGRTEEEKARVEASIA